MIDNYAELVKLKPSQLWRNFAIICQYPRPSLKEQQIAEFIRTRGEELGLDTSTDKFGNVRIAKPATPGMEACKRVVFQAHIDMVTVKNSDIEHDFTKDMIQAYIDGDWVTARGTTLGADDGIGVATILTILEATDIAHGPIVGIFTTDEEYGFSGADGLSSEFLEGDILINLDNETIGSILVGAAGGLICRATAPLQLEAANEADSTLEIIITGSKGGHSGVEIHLGLANANQLLSELLATGSKEFGMRLSRIVGGIAHNVIPSRSKALVTISTAKKEQFISFVENFAKEAKQKHFATDPKMEITVTEVQNVTTVFTVETQQALLTFLTSYPYGVYGWSKQNPDFVESSANLGFIKTSGDTVEFKSMHRSSVEDKKQELGDIIGKLFAAIGATVETKGTVPCWAPDYSSELAKIVQRIYQEQTGDKAIIESIHASVECCAFAKSAPWLDMVSIGPTIRNPHSTSERVEIKSVETYWDVLLAVLKEIPKK